MRKAEKIEVTFASEDNDGRPVDADFLSGVEWAYEELGNV